VPQWGPFFAVTVVVLFTLLFLARLSETAIQQGTADAQEVTNRPEQGDDTTSQEPLVDDSTNGENNDAVKPPLETGDLPGEKWNQDGGSSGQNSENEPSIPTGAVELSAEALMANVAVTQGVVIAVLVAAAWYFSIPAAAFGVTGAPQSTGLAAVAVGAGFGLILWIANEAATTVADIVGAAYDERVREMLAPGTAKGWILLLGVVVPIIAVAEELLFRAALIGVPQAGFGLSPWLLAVVSSLAFALGHGAQGQVGVVVTGALGFVLAAGYILTGSLLVVIVTHYIINALEFILYELFDIALLEKRHTKIG